MGVNGSLNTGNYNQANGTTSVNGTLTTTSYTQTDGTTNVGNLSVANSMNVSGGSTNVSGSTTAGNLTLSGGNVTTQGDVTAGNVTQTNGTLTTNGNLTLRSSVNVMLHATQRTALLRKPPSGEDDRPNDRSILPILAIAAAREPQKCEGAANAPDSRPVALTRVLSANADQQDGNAPTAARAKIARIDRGRQLSLPRLQATELSVARLPPQLLPVGTGAREPSQPGPRLNHPHQPQRTPQLHLLWPRRYPTRATLLPIPLVPPLEPSALQVLS